jgi:hypothetical protein
MFLVNLRTGKTLKVHEPVELEQKVTNPRLISAISILTNGMQHVLPLPLHFRHVRYKIEVGDGFERVVCHADDQIIKLTVYGTSMAKTEVRRTRKIWQKNTV